MKEHNNLGGIMEKVEKIIYDLDPEELGNEPQTEADVDGGAE